MYVQSVYMYKLLSADVNWNNSHCASFVLCNNLIFMLLTLTARLDFWIAMLYINPCNHISFLLTSCDRRDIFPFIFHPFANIYPLVHLPSFQLYDLGSPAESSNTSPGCAPVDDRCSSAEQLPSCGKRGRCHSSRGSFSCLCEPGFTGPSCDQGEHLRKK